MMTISSTYTTSRIILELEFLEKTEWLDLGGVCFFYLMLNRTFCELNAE